MLSALNLVRGEAECGERRRGDVAEGFRPQVSVCTGEELHGNSDSKFGDMVLLLDVSECRNCYCKTLTSQEPCIVYIKCTGYSHLARAAKM